MLPPGEETAVQAVVGSIVWAFRRLKKPKCREMSARGYALHSVCPQLSFFRVLTLVRIRKYFFQDFYIADSAEDQVFLCVNHNDTRSNLYISEVNGTRFTLSLPNIVYYNPKGSNKDTWLR